MSDHYDKIKPVTLLRTLHALMMRKDCDADKQKRLLEVKLEFLVSLSVVFAPASCLHALPGPFPSTSMHSCTLLAPPAAVDHAHLQLAHPLTLTSNLRTVACMHTQATSSTRPAFLYQFVLFTGSGRPSWQCADPAA